MTLIEWVKNPDNETQGITLNSKTGCLNHVNGYCKGGNFPCYAYRLANGRLKQRYLANKSLASCPRPTVAHVNDPFYPRFWPDRLEQIRHRKKPTGIFLDDMSDWMGDYWPEEWTAQELQVMRDCPWHRFYTLTKQPQNLIKWSPFPDNCWVGVTVTTRSMFAEAAYRLDEIEAKVKFVSLEPLLQWERMMASDLLNFLGAFNWVIIGAQTKPYKPPKIEWVREIVDACHKVGIPYFLKDNLAKLFIAPDGEIPQLRQGMPETN